MQEHGDELVRQLEDGENQGMNIDKYLRLRVYVPIVETGQALNGTLRDFSIALEGREQTVKNIFELLRDAVYSFRNTIVKSPSSKVSLSLHMLFQLSVDPAYLSDPHFFLVTQPVEKLEGGMDVNDILERFYTTLLESIDQYEMCGSGWVLDRLLRLDLHVAKYDPLRASTYMPLPKEIRQKHAVVNIRNHDKLCFIWCVIASIYGDPNVQNPHRISHYQQWANAFNLNGLEMPMALKDVAKFERLNNISISVYGYEPKKKNEKGKEEKKKKKKQASFTRSRSRRTLWRGRSTFCSSPTAGGRTTASFETSADSSAHRYYNDLAFSQNFAWYIRDMY